MLAAEKREQEERLLVEMFKKKYESEECPKPRLSNAPQTSSQFAEGSVGRRMTMREGKGDLYVCYVYKNQYTG